MADLPAPVSPYTRENPSVPTLLKSISCLPLDGAILLHYSSAVSFSPLGFFHSLSKPDLFPVPSALSPASSSHINGLEYHRPTSHFRSPRSASSRTAYFHLRASICRQSRIKPAEFVSHRQAAACPSPLSASCPLCSLSVSAAFSSARHTLPDATRIFVFCGTVQFPSPRRRYQSPSLFLRLSSVYERRAQALTLRILPSVEMSQSHVIKRHISPRVPEEFAADRFAVLCFPCLTPRAQNNGLINTLKRFLATVQSFLQFCHNASLIPSNSSPGNCRLLQRESTVASTDVRLLSVFSRAYTALYGERQPARPQQPRFLQQQPGVEPFAPSRLPAGAIHLCTAVLPSPVTMLS